MFILIVHGVIWYFGNKEKKKTKRNNDNTRVNLFRKRSNTRRGKTLGKKPTEKKKKNSNLNYYFITFVMNRNGHNNIDTYCIVRCRRTIKNCCPIIIRQLYFFFFLVVKTVP